MKLSVKINLLFTAIVSGIVLVIAVIIYNISDQNIQKDFEKGRRPVQPGRLTSITCSRMIQRIC